MNDITLLLLLFGIALISGGIGAAIAASRGYSSALGWAVGWTGLAAWLILALLPERGVAERAYSATGRTGAAEERFPRADGLLRLLYPLAIGMYSGVFGSIALASALVPGVRRWFEHDPVAQVVQVVLVLVTVLIVAVIWILSLYLLVKDDRIPPESRGPWTFALIFFNMLAALIFVPWRWRVLRRDRDRMAAAPSVDSPV